MREPWLILADDLTGAADCALPFASRGHPAEVVWTPHSPGKTTHGVVSIDLETRASPATEAAEAHARAASGADGFRLYKKIDSTLRGQPAAEIAAVLRSRASRGFSHFAVLAPAFPSAGRTTVGGRVLLGGIPLEETELFRRSHTYPTSELSAVLSSAGLSCLVIGLEEVRGAESSLKARMEKAARGGVQVAVCDAQTDEDLGRIARVAARIEPHPLCCGSAGFSRALAADGPSGKSPLPRIGARRGGILFAVGSQSGASRAAARALSRLPSVVHIAVDAEPLLEGSGIVGALQGKILHHLSSGTDVLADIAVGTSPNHWQGRILAEGLGRLLRPAAAHAGAFMATGGETARAVLSQFGVTGITLVTEIDPGFPVGLTRGEVSIPVATKAGDFGGEDCLVRCAEFLRRIRDEGRFP